MSVRDQKPDETDEDFAIRIREIRERDRIRALERRRDPVKGEEIRARDRERTADPSAAERRREQSRESARRTAEERRNNPEVREEWLEKQREYARQRYRENPDAQREATARWASKLTDEEREAKKAIAREKAAQRYRENPEKYREIGRIKNADPESKATRSAYWRKRRAFPPEHDGSCGCCGVIPPPKKNGARGLCQDHRHDTGEIRGPLCTGCNVKMGVMDLRYTDPDLWAKLLAWSARGEPVVPRKAENPKRRRKALPEPTLFPSPVDPEPE